MGVTDYNYDPFPAPRWRRDEGARESSRGGVREPEPWESCDERSPGELVLADLEGLAEDPASAAVVVARFAALQLALRGAAGETGGGMLALERLAAAAYLARAAALSARERRALALVLDRASQRPTPDLADALLAAGTAAEGRGHGAGALALYRESYRLAVERGWAAEGARAARAMAALAESAGARYSPRLWRRRAAVLERRAAQS
jgi:hypothetical protein